MTQRGPRLAACGRWARTHEQYRDLEGPGRHRSELTSAQRQAIAERCRKHRNTSIAALRRLIPGLPRNTTAAYVHRLRRLRNRRNRRWARRPVWHLPGAVWAIDGTWLERPVAPFGRRALIVVELHSRKTLCLQSVPGERAAAAMSVLEDLIQKHGAPLVLKLDNGSAFIARCFAKFCRRHGITLMHSPVRRPSWNGTCEVSGRWAKNRATAAAARRGESGALCQADLDAAVTYVGTMPRVDQELRRSFQAVVADQLAVVIDGLGLADNAALSDHRRRSIGRVAVRRALQLCHILTIEGREYRQCQPASAA